jgi:hypothetical protein
MKAHTMACNIPVRLILILTFCTLSHAEKCPTILKTGHYLRSDFIECIKEKPSLRQFAPDDFFLVIVSNGEAGVRFQEIWNFHEGGNIFELSVAHELKQIEGLDAGDLKIRVRSDSSFTLRYGKKPEHRFIWVGSAELWVAQHTVSGTYKDKDGRRYVFSADGRAYFPDKTFPYEIYLDFIPERHDCIIVDGEPHWRFTIESDTLSLFIASNSVPEEIPKEPFLILHKIR